MLQTLDWLLRSPLGLFSEYSGRYGDTFRLRVLGPSDRPDGTRRIAAHHVVVLSRPEHLRDVYERSREELRVGETHLFLRWYLGDDSLLVLDGDRHLAARRLLAPVTSPDAIAGYDRHARAAVARAVATWPAGEAALRPLVEDLALDMDIATAFGTLDEQSVRRLRQLLRRGATVTAVPRPLQFSPLLRADLGPWSPGGRLRRTVAEFRNFVAAGIEARRNGALPADDMLARLVQVHDDSFGRCGPGESAGRERLIDDFVTLLSASESFGAALTWCCYHLGRNPQVLARARQAAREEEESESASAYLDAVCRESLRLNPPFIGALRRVAAPVRVGELSLAVGTIVVPCTFLTHRRAATFEDPLAFRPERFLGRAYGPFEYAPFGMGVRRCVGHALALRQMRIALAGILGAVSFEPATRWTPASRVRSLLIITKDPLRARLTRHADSGVRREEGPGRRRRAAAALFALAPGNGVVAHAFGIVPLALWSRTVLPVALVALIATLAAGSRRRLATLVARGAFWGLVATLAYDVTRLTLRRLAGLDHDPFLAVATFGTALAGHPAGAFAAGAAGWTWHLLNGMGFGIAFALLWPRGGAWAGLSCALLLQLLLMTVHPPLVGVSPGDPGFLVLGFTGHALFGLVLGLGVARAEADHPAAA